MKKAWSTLFVVSLCLGCQLPTEGSEEAAAPAKPAITLQVTPPAPMPVPELKPVASPEDWEARINNKNREVVELLNILNPVAAYLIEGFKQYGPKFNPTLQEEWQDTQEQLTRAQKLYGSCQPRMTSGEKTKELFLALEETWQILVKTGVAGLRTKSMMDAELARIAGG